MDTDKSSVNTFLLQLTLLFILVITIGTGILVRVSGIGFMFLVGGCFLIIIAILHFAIQYKAILRVSSMKPSYIFLILLSDLFFFLGFALQEDTGDGPGGWIALSVFYYEFIMRKSVEYALEHQPTQAQMDIYMSLSLVFLAAMIFSWVLLLGKLFLKKKNGGEFRSNNRLGFW